VIEPEYAGWRQEQAAWHDGVSISDLSHHMSDTFIAGAGRDPSRVIAGIASKIKLSCALDAGFPRLSAHDNSC